jgi:hypothetical protein
MLIGLDCEITIPNLPTLYGFSPQTLKSPEAKNNVKIGALLY